MKSHRARDTIRLPPQFILPRFHFSPFPPPPLPIPVAEDLSGSGPHGCPYGRSSTASSQHSWVRHLHGDESKTLAMGSWRRGSPRDKGVSFSNRGGDPPPLLSFFFKKSPGPAPLASPRSGLDPFKMRGSSQFPSYALLYDTPLAPTKKTSGGNRRQPPTRPKITAGGRWGSSFCDPFCSRVFSGTQWFGMDLVGLRAAATWIEARVGGRWIPAQTKGRKVVRLQFGVALTESQKKY